MRVPDFRNAVPSFLSFPAIRIAESGNHERNAGRDRNAPMFEAIGRNVDAVEDSAFRKGWESTGNGSREGIFGSGFGLFGRV